MYLSELELKIGAVRNPYEIHRQLWKAFPGIPDDNRPFLYRASIDRSGRNITVLMQSDIEPDISGLRREIRLVRSRAYNPKLREGRLLRFRICANPTKRLSKERVRVPLIKEEEQHEWLKRLIGKAAEVLECRVIEKRILYFKKERNRGKIATVTFEGILKVLDSSELMNKVGSGIGPAKSFGCGMISLAGG